MGWDYGSGTSGTLAERWNSSKWSIQPTPSHGTEGIPYAAVSCGSATSCTAVGYYGFNDPGFATSAVADHWDGHSWTSQPLPPFGDPGGDLTSISCQHATCTVHRHRQQHRGALEWPSLDGAGHSQPVTCALAPLQDRQGFSRPGEREGAIADRHSLSGAEVVDVPAA